MTEPSSSSDAARLRATLVVLACALLVIAPPPSGALDRTAVGWLSAPVLLLLAMGRPTLTAARLVGVASLCVGVVARALAAPDRPDRGMAILLGGVVLGTLVWPSRRLVAARDQDPMGPPWEPSMVALLVGLLAWLAPLDDAAPAPWTLALTYLVNLWATQWGSPNAEPSDRSRGLEGAALVLACVPLVDLVAAWHGPALAPLGVLSPLLLLLQRLHRRTRGLGLGEGWTDAMLVHPSRVLVLSFLGLCGIGTLALSLPVATTGPARLGVFDAAFTAVSATCVTGLAVVDTSTAFTRFGQLVILVLIQVGGLGIMVFSTSAATILGERLSLREERAAVALVGASSRASLASTLRAIVRVTLVTEGLTALVLFVRFSMRGEAGLQAAWRALFTAVSAFCNAGFALQTDSLMPYADDPVVMTAVGCAIVVGGLGPVVVVGASTWRRLPKPTLHTRVVLAMSAGLTLVPAVLFAVFEADGTMAASSIGGTLGHALFHAVTLRTAGFNAIDLTQTTPVSLVMMLVLMVIGGSPGSTAGGVKTTTLFVLGLVVFSALRERTSMEAFGRTLPDRSAFRAVTIVALALTSVLLAVAALLLTQDMPASMALFEATSALGTVGLTIGGTARLDEMGKVIVIACMFAGRVGPLTLLSFLFWDGGRPSPVRYPQESLPVG